MDVLVRIKRLVIARRVEFTMKATEERLRDGLSVEDVLESIVNANAIKKVLRSRSVGRVEARERHRRVGRHEGNIPPQRWTGGLPCLRRLRLGEARGLGGAARGEDVRGAGRRGSSR